MRGAPGRLAHGYHSHPLPVDPDIGQDAPIDLQYVRGNRFLVVNAYTVPISVTYRVAGGGEEGTAEVAAAASEDPAVSETMIETGSGDGKNAPDEKNAELFSPPYLFRGSRPTITRAPSSVRYGEQFRLGTPDAQRITHVSLIRLGAVTHAFDQNQQRFQRLAFTADATGLTVTAPLSGNQAPPGHYMVFILNGVAAPSIARIIRIH